MDKNLIVKKEIKIAADREVVWDAIVNPGKIKEYLFGTEVICDWQIGSPIIFQGEFQDKSYKDKGTILGIRSGEFLEYDYWSGFSGLEDKPENYSLVKYTLQNEGEYIVLNVSQQGFANEDALKHAESAWPQVLEKIKEITEE